MNSTLILCVWPPGWQSKACTFKPFTVHAVPCPCRNYVTCKVDRKCLREYENKYRSTGRRGAYVGETGGIRGWSWDKGQRDKECSGDVQRNQNSVRVSFQTSANYLVYMSEYKAGEGREEKCYFRIFNGYKKQLELPKRYCFLNYWVMRPKLFAIIRIFPIGSAGLDLLDF